MTQFLVGKYFSCLLCFYSFLVVNVSLPNSASASEDIGQIMVCVNLKAAANTEREFKVQLDTEEDSAKGMTSSLYYHCY